MEKQGAIILDLDTIFDDDRAPVTAELLSAAPEPLKHDSVTTAPAHRLTPDDLPGDWRCWFEERAAIREYDGGQAREHAEAEALRETLDAMRQAGEL